MSPEDLKPERLMPLEIFEYTYQTACKLKNLSVYLNNTVSIIQMYSCASALTLALSYISLY